MEASIRKQERDSKLSDVKLSYIKKHLLGDKILDVGAGHCYYSDWIVEQFPQTYTTALDHLDLTSEQLPPSVTYYAVDLEKPFPLEAEVFSTLLAFDIIEHIANEQQLVAELFRVCKPGGVLIGSVPHDDDKFLPAYNLTFNHRSDLTHKRYYVPKTLQKTLESAGFIPIAIDEQGGASPQVIAEFFSEPVQPIIKKFIGLLRRVGVINTIKLSSDLFFIARKPVR
jgi:SAM-dependent methyltransferase